MSKITDIYAKPNRRTRGQRRLGQTERRRQSIWVQNCRRSQQTDRRQNTDRRPDTSAEWTTVKTIKPIARKFVSMATSAKIGSVINISV